MQLIKRYAWMVMLLAIVLALGIRFPNLLKLPNYWITPSIALTIGLFCLAFNEKEKEKLKTCRSTEAELSDLKLRIVFGNICFVAFLYLAVLLLVLNVKSDVESQRNREKLIEMMERSGKKH